MKKPKGARPLSTSDVEPLDYEALFRASDERKVVFRANDPDYTFVNVTDEHIAMTGVPRDKLIGRNFFDVFPDVSEKYKRTGVSDLREIFRKVIRTKRPLANETIRYDVADGKGGYAEKYWKPVHYPLLDKAGHVAYILQASADATNEVVAERGMRQISEQLDEALKIGGVGSWVWDIDTNIVAANSIMAKMFGVNPRAASKGLPVEKFMGIIHVEDRDRVNAALARAIRQKHLFEAEYRTVDHKGRIRWVIVRGKLQEHDGKRTFPGVLVDITERRDLQAQIELAKQQDRLNRQSAKSLQDRNEELETISRTKDEFVALASHQLRTPATAVKQYLGMVLQGYVGDISELQADMLAKAFESNERQIKIINQILNAARVDTGRLVMTPTEVDLTALVRNIADEMRASIEQRGHTFAVSLPKTEQPVLADTGYLRMAIENLLHNACIYTPEGGKIELRLEKIDTGRVRMSISDNGVGIRKKDQTKLFAKFSRIHNSLSVQAGGSGIGLYLTAEIVRLHGGSVTVESKINKGTTFAIVLPIGDNTIKAERNN